MTDNPSPFELWQQASGDAARYRELLVEHGHLVRREPGDDGNLPCGWPGPRRDIDGTGLTAGEDFTAHQEDDLGAHPEDWP